MKRKYDILTSKEISLLLRKILNNSFKLNTPKENTQTKLANSLKKSGGVIGHQLLALKKEGILNKYRYGQSMIYEFNVYGFLSIINKKKLDFKHQLDDKELKELTDEIKVVADELIIIQEETDTILMILERATDKLKSEAELASFFKEGLTFGIEPTKLSVHMKDISIKILEKLQKLKTPNTLDRIYSILKKYKELKEQ